MTRVLLFDLRLYRTRWARLFGVVFKLVGQLHSKIPQDRTILRDAAFISKWGNGTLLCAFTHLRTHVWVSSF